MAIITGKHSGRVLVFGTFDGLHPGHQNFFRQARRYGSELIVAIGRDRVVEHVKGRRPQRSETTRQRQVAAERMVDRAVLAPRDPRQRYSFIRRWKPSVLALGHDQRVYAVNLQAELRRRNIVCRVVRLRPFHRERYRSSLLRR